MRGIRLSKSMGQHILASHAYLRKIIDCCDFDAVDLILEVGPGPGNLTQLLVDEGKSVLAVELDSRFIASLEKKFAGIDHFQLYNCDILTRGRISSQITSELDKVPHLRWALVSNLPYNVASTVMVESLYCKCPPAFMCVTIQKEVAQRVTGTHGLKTYGPLSVLCQAVASAKFIATIPPGAFVPPPRVHSGIVKLSFDPLLASKIADYDFFRKFVTRIFRHRRKTIRSGWIKKLPEPRQIVMTSELEKLGIDSESRPESLEPNHCVALANKLYHLQMS